MNKIRSKHLVHALVIFMTIVFTLFAVAISLTRQYSEEYKILFNIAGTLAYIALIPFTILLWRGLN